MKNCTYDIVNGETGLSLLELLRYVDKQFAEVLDTEEKASINDIVYSKFINGLKKANIEINRKMLSELAIFAPEEFTKLVKLAKDALEGKAPKVEKETVEKKVEKTVEAKKDYSKLTVAELKELCEEKKIDTTGMKKADLVAALEK